MSEWIDYDQRLLAEQWEKDMWRRIAEEEAEEMKAREVKGE